MKKLLLITLLWAAIQSYAQIIDTTGGFTMIDSSNYRFEQNWKFFIIPTFRYFSDND